jgi:hypothetical protein
MLTPRFASVIAVVASALTGCADGTLPPVTSLADPSNPAAREAPLPPPPAMFGASSTPPLVAPSPPPGDVVYVCPMHSQIVRDAPGTCPICGMTLVPRPRPAAAPAPRDHDHLHGDMK